MYKLVLLRHGQSTWNAENRFTGWADAPLTERGENEAKESGRKMKEAGFVFDEVHTNLLKRAIKTTWLALEAMDLMWIPIHLTWRLNERHYGALQGLNKSETAQKYGEEQVLQWRRGYDVRPPLLTKDDERYSGNDPQYALLDETEIPLGESLKDTLDRTIPYYLNNILTEVQEGKSVLISASHNSLRAIVKYIQNISDDDIMDLTIPTGIPLVYELDDDLKYTNHHYLASDEELKKAVEEVKDQGKAQ